MDVLTQLLDTLAANPGMTKALLLERWRDHPHFDYLQRLSVHPFLRDVDDEGMAADFGGALTRLGEQVRKAEQFIRFSQRQPSGRPPGSSTDG